MDEKSLDKLLRLRGETVGASLPANFQQNVWREIRQRRGTNSSAFAIFSSWQWLLRPQFATVCLVIATAVGVAVGSRQPDRVALSTRHALHLDVFGPTAPALPSTVLAWNL